MKKIAIIGAGLAGLTLAKRLNKIAGVTIFEKSRGVGGRLATRYADPFQFDHGAQFFTVQSKQFNDFIQPLLSQSIIKPWDAKFVEIDRYKISASQQWDEHNPHYVGFPKMNQIGKYLANNLNIKLQTRITKIISTNKQWQLFDENNHDLGTFDWVITATPVQQAIDLLPKPFCYFDKIKHINMQGCFSLMLGFNRSLPLAWDVACVKNSDISWISINNSKPGRPKAFSMLIHATNTWAEEHMEDHFDDVKNHLFTELEIVLDMNINNADHIDLHRWRFANSHKQTTQHAFIDAENKLAACGDWCIEGRVEAAFLSGNYLAENLIPMIE